MEQSDKVVQPTVESSVFTVGSNSQTGDIHVRDVVGGNITNLNIFAEKPALNDSALRLVDARFNETKEFPELDIKVRNTGERVAFIKRCQIDVLRRWKLLPIFKPAHVPSSWTYDIDLSVHAPVPYSICHGIEQSVEPSSVDRFTIKLGTDSQEVCGFIFFVQLHFLYDEDDKLFSTPELMYFTNSAVRVHASWSSREYTKEITRCNKHTINEISGISAARSSRLEQIIADFAKIPDDI